MDITAFSQLGIGLATLLILWFVVKYFIEALSKKDTYIEKIVDNFTITMTNHIEHETASWKEASIAQIRTSKSLDNLSKAINQWGKATNKQKIV